MWQTVSDVEAWLVSQGVASNVAAQEAPALLRYGSPDEVSRLNGSGWIDRYLVRSDRPTASGGGIGGDLDLDENGIIDLGWILVDAQAGDPGYVRASDLAAFDFANDAQRAVSVNVGGQSAADVFRAVSREIAFGGGMPTAPGRTVAAPNTGSGPAYATAVSGSMLSPQSASPSLVPGPRATAAAGGLVLPAGLSPMVLVAAAAAFFFLKK